MGNLILILCILFIAAVSLYLWMERREKKFKANAKKRDRCRFSYIGKTKLHNGTIEEYESTYIFALVKDSDGFIAKVHTHSIKPPKLCETKKPGQIKYFPNY